ncbi:MAG: GH3 auxin-responsive promoter family protein [Bacteroides sp.]
MGIGSAVARLASSQYLRRIGAFMRHPLMAQHGVLGYLLQQGRRTRYGQQHRLDTVHGYRDFCQALPLAHYEDLEPQIEEMRRGGRDILWPGITRWFAKSSGTTGHKSKFIPVTNDALRLCHYRGGYDTLALYIHQHPHTQFYHGKGLTLGGSHTLEKGYGKSKEGDLSAILIQNIPRWADFIRTPKRDVALLADWTKKLELIANEVVHQRVTNLSGVPSWNMVMLNYLLEVTGKPNISELWPHLEVFFHGGVSFTPYRDQYQRLIPSACMHYMEIYNASEGFFALQDRESSDELLLMLDYGVLYEFIPMSTFHTEHPTVLPLEGVKLGENYALVITSTNGLWRYVIGDTVRFTNLSPYRIKITGRTRHFINAFGEEVIVDNADQALAWACEVTGATVTDYTASPIFMGADAKGAHEWIVEFSTPPTSLQLFRDLMDQRLKEVNSDYEAKRRNSFTLLPPTMHAVPPGSFMQWMAQRGKLGGQNKVPRLANNREYTEAILAFMQEAGIGMETV